MYLTNDPNRHYQVVDIEANGLEPDTVWCLVAFDMQTKEYSEHVGHEAIKAWCDVHTADVLVGHNFLSYDLPVLNRLLHTTLDPNLVLDTLVLSFLYSPHLDGGHGLGAYGERFGLPKLDHEDWMQFSAEMLARCRRDVQINVRVLLALRQKMLEIGFSELSCEIEHAARMCVNEQEDTGFKFDTEAGIAFYERLVSLREELAAEVHKYFPPQLYIDRTCIYKIKKDGSEGKTLAAHREQFPKIVVRPKDGEYDCYAWREFNLGSPLQRRERMLAIGYEAVNFTKKTKAGGGNNPVVDEDGLLAFLEDCTEEQKPAVKAMAEWMVVYARSTMVAGWLKAVGADDCIHGSVWTCGAGSRRCTHDNPNTANIPSGEAKYGEECRSLWTARPGRVMCGVDAKSIQMRMFGHYLGNVELGMEYAEGDPHQRNADAADVPRKKVKNCFYAMIFGAQDAKLGKTGHGGTGTAAQGTAIRMALYETTPGLEDLFKVAARAYNDDNGWMECIDGGWVRCPSAHSALNYWIQSAEAVLMKMTMVKVWRAIKRLGLDAFQVGFIHDELQYDCKDQETAERVADLFKRAIASSGRFLKFIIPMEGDAKYGATWAQTH